MAEAREENPVAANEAAEVPVASRVDVIMAEPEEERPLEVVERELVAEASFPTDAPSSQVDQEGPSGTISSPIAVTILESTQISLSGLLDIASSLGMVLELSTTGFVDIPVLVMVPVLLLIVPLP